MQVDPDVVLVELDEVKVHAQAHTGRKEVLALTAVVMIAGRCWHLAAATTRGVGLPGGGVAGGAGRPSRHAAAAGAGRWGAVDPRVVRGAGAQRRDDDRVLVAPGEAVRQDLSRACRGREHRREVESAVLKALWHGRVDEALEVLRSRSGEMRNVEVLEDLIGYLEARRPYLPDYEARQRAGLWIASNRVEKFNDWSVSARCKHQGMEWTEAGVVALAVLEAARRNGELPTWRAKHSLPAWKVPRGRKKVA